MRIFNDLLFHHGFVANAELARQLVEVAPPAPAAASHPHRHSREQVRARQARRVRTLAAPSPFR